MAQLGGNDWRPEYRAALPDVPPWFVDDRTDLSGRLSEIQARTLLLWSDADPVSPLSVAQFLVERISDAHLVTVAGGTHTPSRTSGRRKWPRRRDQIVLGERGRS